MFHPVTPKEIVRTGYDEQGCATSLSAFRSPVMGNMAYPKRVLRLAPWRNMIVVADLVDYGKCQDVTRTAMETDSAGKRIRRGTSGTLSGPERSLARLLTTRVPGGSL